MKAFNSHEGLDTDIIKCITQDSLGFIWIGSDDGLFKYDGITFQKFPQSASSKYFKDFVYTSGGDLLAVHDLGIVQIHSSLDTTYFTSLLDGQRMYTDSTLWYPKTLYEDDKGYYWIAEPQSVVRYKEGKWTRFEFGPSDNTNSFVRSFNFLQVDKNYLVISSNNGNYYCYHYASGEITPLKVNLPKMSTYQLRKMNGVDYVATEKGLYKATFSDDSVLLSSVKLEGISGHSEIRQLTPIDENRFVIASIYGNTAIVETHDFKHYNAKAILQTHRMVNQAFVSSDKSIWLSTEKGILLVTLPDFKRILLNPPNSYMESLITSTEQNLIYTLRKANIWTIDKTTGEAKDYFSSDDFYFLSGSLVGDDLWIASESEIIQFRDGIIESRLDFTAEGRYIFHLITGYDNHLWFGQESFYGLRRLDPETKKVEVFAADEGLPTEVDGVYASPEGIFAYASFPDHYLFYKAYHEDRFKDISLSFPQECRKGLTIEAIELQDSVIWLATNFGLFRQCYGELKKIEISRLFEESAVKTISLNGEFLWVASTSGLIRYNTRSGDYAHFTESSGLPVNTVSQECLIINHNQIWVGTSQGVAVSDHKQNANFIKTPTPYIIKYTSNDRKIHINSTNKTPKVPFESYVGITFSSLLFPASDMYYSYRLNGGNWSSPQTQNEVNFSSLKDGKYTFEVKAKRIGNYSWSDPRKLQFVVNSPFYKKVPFYALILLIIGIAVSSTRYYTYNASKRRQLLLQKLVAERTDELNAIKNQLEVLVQQRTKELEQTVDQLTTAQDQLIQAEKMASLGILTAGIAHEINNPVNYLKGGLYSLDKLMKQTDKFQIDPETNDDLHEVLGFMKLGIDRITTIVAGLSRYSRKSNKSLGPCNLHEILSNCLLIMEHELKGRINVHTEMLAVQHTVLGDEGALHQLFINLITNAAHSILEYGEIYVKTMNENNSIIVCLEDTGSGIDKQSLDKLFDPFFTTKAPGQGTGLGLFISKKIVSEHSGDIRFDSVIDSGTKVFVTFSTSD